MTKNDIYIDFFKWLVIFPGVVDDIF